MKMSKHQELLNEMRVKLIEKELEINQGCAGKKVKNMRYFVCQFGKESGLEGEDMAICRGGKVAGFAAYIRGQPIFGSFKKEVGEFLELCEVLEGIFAE